MRSVDVSARTILIVEIFRARIGRGRDSLVGHSLHDGNVFFKLGGIGREWERTHGQRVTRKPTNDKIFFVFSLIIFFEKRLDKANEQQSNGCRNSLVFNDLGRRGGAAPVTH
jgi:hypothetical protein